jgi:hypothetical protein
VVFCQAGELFGGLNGEFSGGREDKNLCRPAVGVDALNCRDAERCRLSCPGLGLAGHVAAFEYHWYCAYLDRRGLLKAQVFYRLECLLRDIEILKGNVIFHSFISWCLCIFILWG